MKKKLILFTVIALLLGGVGCEKEVTKNDFITSPGIIPNNSAMIENVFELKYGEIYDYNYDGINYSFSIVDVVDSVSLDCANVPLQTIDPFHPLSSVKTHVFLHIKIDDKTTQKIKISSKQCGAMKYDNGDNIAEITNMFENWNKNLEKDSFVNEFERYFGEGTYIGNHSLSIFMAKSYPVEYKQVEKKKYKFIFVLTK